MLSRLYMHARSNGVAYLALFVALGGTAAAARPLLDGGDVQDGTLNSADLRDRGSSAWPGPSIQGTDVEANTLGGAEIDESGLGKVGDADTLDTKNSSDFLGATAKAADSDRLDGTDKLAFGAGVFTARVTGGPVDGLTGTVFAAPNGTSAYGAESDVTQIVPLPPAGGSGFVVRDLAVKANVTGTPGAPGFVRFTLRDDGVDTAVSCSIPPGAGVCGSTGIDGINEMTEVALKIEIFTNGSPVVLHPESGDGLQFGWRATMPAG